MLSQMSVNCTCEIGGDIFFFFFSSRRRHTRFDCDWSSDVCSSDLCRTPSAGTRSTRMSVTAMLVAWVSIVDDANPTCRSEEHTSELQSQSNLVCRLLLEKKKKNPSRTMLKTQLVPPLTVKHRLTRL